MELRSIEEELAAHEPSPELLLQLAHILPPEFVQAAIDIVRGIGPEPISMQILVSLVKAADEGDAERIEEIIRQNEFLLENPPPLTLPLADDVVDRLGALDAPRRAELLEPVLRSLHHRFMPAAANGGGGPKNGDSAMEEGEAGGGGPPPAANGDEGELGVANGHGSSRKPPRRPRFVSTGFATPEAPQRPLPRREPLATGTAYRFWLEIGRPVTGSIEETHEEVLPEQQLEAGTRIRVVVYPFDGELILAADAREGDLVLDDEGQFNVGRQPGTDGPAGGRRLFFPVSTPTKPGTYRLRCSLYFRNVLVQSRVVSAAVGQPPAAKRPALTAKVDFRMARMLSAAELAPIRQHALSVQLNSNGEGTHEFRFFGDEPGSKAFVENARIGEGALQDVINRARGELRRASWGSNLPFQKTDEYRYLDPEPGQLEQDLFALMGEGFRIYDALINDLAGGSPAADKLRERMVRPGRIQIISHGAPSELVPASIVYDYMNAKPGSTNLRLCPQFVADRKGAPPLEEAICFKGGCPSREEPNVVCPSGFWGYRHALGMPVTSHVPEAIPLESRFDQSPVLGLAIFPDFELIDEHRDDLQDEVPGWEMRVAETFDSTLDLLRSHPNVLYFYCHGGLTSGNTPFLRVGPEDGPRLERTDLRLTGPDVFKAPRALVVLNGCRTAALEPDRAIELVSAFVQNAGSMGVIGTEVTIFEELASAFGSQLLRNLRAGVEVGESVRRARLALLKQGNPLGLVYLPLVASDARLVAAN